MLEFRGKEREEGKCKKRRGRQTWGYGRLGVIASLFRSGVGGLRCRGYS